MTFPGDGEGGRDSSRPPPDVDVHLPPGEQQSPPAEEAPPPEEREEPAAPEPKPPKDRRPLALANLALGRSEVAFLAVLLIGEALAFGQDLIGGIARSFVTVARIGGLYVFGSFRVPIQLRATASGVNGTFLDLSIALLTITAVAIVLLFRGGETVGERASGGLLRRGLWGAVVGVPFGLFTFLLSLLVGIHFRLPVIEGGEVAIGVSKPWAAVIPLTVGLVTGFLGGVWSGLSRADATRPVSAGAKPPGRARVLAGGAFAGAWRMFVAALGLSFVGLLVLAGLHPSSTRAYIDGTFGGGKSGMDLAAHHALALPNQSMFVLVPAMGGCDVVRGTAEPNTFLCYSTFPKHGSVNLTAPLLRGRRQVLASPFRDVRFGDAPGELWAFLLIPLVATVLGGIRAAKPAGRRGQAAAAGALAGVGYSALVVAGCLAAALSIRFYGGTAPASLTVLPDPVTGGLLGLGWGVAGGAIGAFLGWRPAVKKAAPVGPLPSTAASTTSSTAAPASPPQASAGNPSTPSTP